MLVLEGHSREVKPVSKWNRVVCFCSLVRGGGAELRTTALVCSGIVNRISPDTALHEQNGYAKLLDHKYTFKTNIETNVDNDNSDKTYTNMHEV